MAKQMCGVEKDYVHEEQEDINDSEADVKVLDNKRRAMLQHRLKDLASKHEHSEANGNCGDGLRRYQLALQRGDEQREGAAQRGRARGNPTIYRASTRRRKICN